MTEEEDDHTRPATDGGSVSETCGNCRFYRPRKDINYLGYCRRFPPTLIKKFYQSGNTDGAEGGFPQSDKGEWCGEWAERPA